MSDGAMVQPNGVRRPRRTAVPARVHDGLAVYDLGGGPPLLIMPNPQGMVRAPEASSPLVELLVGLGRRVITFDPPGAFASTRPPRLGLAEMLAGAQEALRVAGVVPPVDVVGHSQATLCQLTLALTAPATVRSLVLVGAVDGGWRTTRRADGMPWCWPLTDRRRWYFARLAAPLALGWANLGRLKRLQQLYLEASFVDRSLVPAVAIEPGDDRRPPPRRARWQASIRQVDLRPRLGEIKAPTLVGVGRHDPQTPWPDNAAIAAALPAGRLEVFERSGHYPYLEEPERFAAVVSAFFSLVARQVP
jgi:pimeloyl-ACP methyl ester carboxylesterase